MTDWDDAYANMAHITGGDALPDRWMADAAAYRASGVWIEEHAYGADERELFDLVWPDGTPKGIAVFVHGGYWIQTDKSFWTDLAEGARASGWAVCLPQYTLAPDARIAQITQQIGRAITVAAHMVAGPIRLAGHSAGGHLVARMMCDDTPLFPDLNARVDHCLSISGLHDLRPLMRTKMNAKLQLDPPEAARESAALRTPHPRANITAWVGGCERPEFIRQARMLPLMWAGFDVTARLVLDGEHNHFSLLDGLKDKDSAIANAFVGV